MLAQPQPVYFVDPLSEPVVIHIRGRATMHNTHLLKLFCDESIQDGHRCFVLDFEECQGMDSTFLGTVKELTGKLRNSQPAGKVVAVRMGEDNLENFCMVGLDQLDNLQCNPPWEELEHHALEQALQGPRPTRDVYHELVRRAHQVLADDPALRDEFEEVNRLMNPGDGSKAT